MIRKIVKASGIALFMMWVLPGYAQDAVKLIHPDDGETVFMLNSHPKVSIAGDVVVMETDVDRVEYDYVDGMKIKFYDSTGAVESITTEGPVFSVGHESVEGQNLAPGQAVAVYDISGKKLRGATVGADGRVEVSTSDLGSGVYIFHSKDKNFKFYKK